MTPRALMKGVLMIGIVSFADIACRRPAGEGAASAEKPATATRAATAPSGGLATAVFAGGCFWCTEAAFEPLEGVEDVVSGYAGGSKETADYETVSSGRTLHAESIKVTYDPSRITYNELLRVFFAAHDPTQLNRQGPDTGAHYRSAIFYADQEQKQAAEAHIRQLQESGAYGKPIVTRLEPLTAFFPAEDYHQDYARQHPNNPYIRVNAFPKVEKIRKLFRGQIRPASETQSRPG